MLIRDVKYNLLKFIFDNGEGVGFPRDRDHPAGGPGPVGKWDGM